jgi:ubiquinone/menaquinone biosynthesis C-methylase UbiE
LNINGIIAWISGNMKNTEVMKDDIKAAYNGDKTLDVENYDAYGWDHYSKVADALLQDLEIQGKHVLDLGCGTGILTLKLLERDAGKICAVDISEYMVGVLKKKIEAGGYPSNSVDFSVADAEKLPFDDCVFDLVISSMVFGMVPNQAGMMSEMVRIVKPGGMIALSTHGPTHYAELSDAVFAAIPKRYMLGRRILYWPRGTERMQKFFQTSGLCDVLVKQSVWQDSFQDSHDMYEFIASSTGNFYASFVPDQMIRSVLDNIRRYFVDKKIQKITLDVVYAYGKKTSE